MKVSLDLFVFRSHVVKDLSGEPYLKGLNRKARCRLRDTGLIESSERLIADVTCAEELGIHCLTNLCLLIAGQIAAVLLSTPIVLRRGSLWTSRDDAHFAASHPRGNPASVECAS